MNLEDLSPELREKAKTCKTPEEILELARSEGYELSDEQLSSVAGGSPDWLNACVIDGCEDHAGNWE